MTICRASYLLGESRHTLSQPCFAAGWSYDLTAAAYLNVRRRVHGVIGRICHSLKVDDSDLLGLPNPVGSGNSLLLILGVGVGVIHHHSVCCLQIQAPAGCPDAQQEDEHLAVGCIEALDGDFPALSHNPAISGQPLWYTSIVYHCYGKVWFLVSGCESQSCRLHQHVRLVCPWVAKVSCLTCTLPHDFNMAENDYTTHTAWDVREGEEAQGGLCSAHHPS